MKVTILSGSGRYQDEWHDFTATSVEVAKVVQRMGLSVAVRAFKAQGVRQDVPDADLVVVNSGHGEYRPISDGPEDGWTEAYQTLRDYRARGGALLALHIASRSLEGLDEWPDWIGGRWVQGRSMHPPIGETRVEVTTTDHPITAGLEPFSLLDERYCHLEIAPTSRILLHHEYEGGRQPLVWAVESDGGRTVYDALGHDVRSFASAGRTELLRREVQWLLGR
jgi:type 1 glutamine amidotransferase